MTVSPQWPDEGKIPQFSEGNPDLARLSGPSSALPPTLFQLPNLRIDSPRAAGLTENSGVASTPNSPDFTSRVAEMPFGNTESAEKLAGLDSAMHDRADPAPQRRQSDDQPRFPTPPAVVDGVETPANGRSEGINRESISRYAGNQSASDGAEVTPLASTDRPAGRSWMDSIGSHGIVVALLLVVVAAALYTGRAGKNDPPDASLADGRDWLEYDSGDEISLPNTPVDGDPEIMPIRETDRTLVGAETPEGELASGSLLASEEIKVATSVDTSSALLSQPVESNGGSDSKASVVATKSGSAGGQFPQLQASLASPASAAANRANQFSSQPSQARQTGQPTGYGIAVPEIQNSRYQQTATPAGITDWSKYFPRVSSGSTVSPNYPSPSN